MYKFLDLDDGKLCSYYGNHEWTVGKEYEVSGAIELCSRGFHASDRIIDAFSFVQGNILAIVECGGYCIADANKKVWQRMRILRAYHWTPDDSVALAIVAAESVLPIYEAWAPGDDRPRRAIDLARDADADAAARADAAAAARADAAAAAARASADAAAAAAPARAGAAAAAAADAAYAAYAASYAADAACAAADAACAAAYAAAAAVADAVCASAAACAVADAVYAAADAGTLAATAKIEEWLVEHIAALRPYA